MRCYYERRIVRNNFDLVIKYITTWVINILFPIAIECNRELLHILITVFVVSTPNCSLVTVSLRLQFHYVNKPSTNLLHHLILLSVAQNVINNL